MADLGMLHLIPSLTKLSGVREDPWGHIGEGISLSRIFSQSGRNLALLPLTICIYMDIMLNHLTFLEFIAAQSLIHPCFITDSPLQVVPVADAGKYHLLLHQEM